MKYMKNIYYKGMKIILLLLCFSFLSFVINAQVATWEVQSDNSYASKEVIEGEEGHFTFTPVQNIAVGFISELALEEGGEFQNGFLIEGEVCLILENGKVIGEYGEISSSTSLKLLRNGSFIEYHKNDERIHTGSIEMNDGLKVQVYDFGGNLNNIDNFGEDFIGIGDDVLSHYDRCNVLSEGPPNSVPPYEPNPITNEEKNWTQTTIYNGKGEDDCHIIGEARQYYDDLGRPTQAQTKDIMGDKVWAIQTIYDVYGRPVISTLPAPTGQNFIEYDINFIRNQNENDYNWADDFDKQVNFNNDNDADDLGELNYPRTFATGTPGTLGYYYAGTNPVDGERATTDYPYSRIEYSEITGAARRVASPGNEHRMGRGHESSSYTMKLANKHELFTVLGYGISPLDWVLKYDENNDGKSDFYDDKQVVPTTTIPMTSHKFLKTIGIDADGKQAVVFSDYNGNEIAKALVGTTATNLQKIVAYVQPGNFHDFHIPQGCAIVSIQGTTECDPQTTPTYTFYDLKNDKNLGNSIPSNPGFYRVVVDENGGCAELKYTVNYYNYTVNVYNDKNQLVASVPPNGVNPVSINFHAGNHPQITLPLHTQLSLFRHNFKGQLLWSQTVDAGKTRYAYSTDGKLRYTQNAKQKIDGRFSYTNYDRVGRVIEVGEYEPPYYNSVPQSPTTAYYFPDDPMRDIVGIHQAVYAPTNVNFVATNPISEIHSATYSAYDSPVSGSGRTQRFTIGKLSKTWNENGITWYSYNAEGELVWEAINTIDLGTKYTDYTYDLIGNVTRVEYQKSATDAFTHFYTYDFDGRITIVQTEDAQGNKKTQAQYDYYQDGSVKELDIAQGLQTMQYRYTIHGWLKSINGDHINNSSNNDNVFSMSLEYYEGDYNPANDATNDLTFDNSTWEESFTGNITAWRWKNNTGIGSFDGRYGYKFHYNARNELAEAKFGQSVVSDAGNAYINIYTDNRYRTSYQYDMNGNITTLNRRAGSSSTIDMQTYHYYSGTNKLSNIQDIIQSSTVGDIGNQANNNYIYNNIGELIQDTDENNKIFYDVYGKVTEVKTLAGVTKVKYYYDANGQRIKKASYNNGSVAKFTYYIGGSIYEDLGGIPEQKEVTINGSGRIGVAYINGTMVDYHYELTDHLGNVRAVIKKAAPGSATPLVVLSYADYYAFGWQMPGRNQQGDYRYAYQGQEKDPETGWEAFELRMYDGRVGRWMTTDPYSQFHSPYLAMANDPINRIDPDGGFVPFGTIAGAIIGAGVALYKNENVWKGALSGAAAGAVFDAIVYTGGLAAAPLLAAGGGTTFGSALVTGATAIVAGGASGATGAIVEQGWDYIADGTPFNGREIRNSAIFAAALGPLGGVAHRYASKVFSRVYKYFDLRSVRKMNASSLGVKSDKAIRELLIVDGDFRGGLDLLIKETGSTEAQVLLARYNRMVIENMHGIIHPKNYQAELDSIITKVFNILDATKR
jgi:RHS repeat-associated protein